MNNYLKNYLNAISDNNQNELYNDKEGFIKGNMFSNLYEQYKNYKPYKLMPNNKQAEALLKVDELTFAAHDLNLLLDVYPNDTAMINKFNEYRKEADKAIREYQDMYGPLELSSNSLENTTWEWEKTSWPWEGTNV